VFVGFRRKTKGLSAVDRKERQINAGKSGNTEVVKREKKKEESK